MGYHISGTPVLAVADAIKNRDEKQLKITREAISEYLDDEKEIEKTLYSFEKPENIAKFFSGTIEDSFKKLGLGIDWRRQFTTGENIYNKFIEWQYKKLKDLGILTQGKYPILYSTKDENAVGEDDIEDGDTNKVTIQEMTYILFKSVKNSDTYFVIATLRADALFGATNLWIKKDMPLVKIKINDQKWIISKDAYIKIQHQFENVKIISEHLGKEFIAEKVTVPLIDRKIPIAEANFIDSKHGTGIVYSSPAGSPHDFMALKEAKNENRIPKEINVINTVETRDKKGNIIKYQGSCPAEDKCIQFQVKNSEDEENLEKAKTQLYKEEHYGGKLNENAGEFSGMYIKDAKTKVKEKLIESGYAGILLETSRRAKTRSKDDVIVAKLDGQWFLDYSSDETKKKAFELLERTLYLPHKLKETQKAYLEWVEKRPCARKRGLGTPLPYDREWIIEPLSDSTIYQLLYEIIHIIREKNIDYNCLSEGVFDYLYLDKGDIEKIAKDSKIDIEILKAMKNETNYWANNDFRYVGQPHMSNHLSFLIYHYALIFDNPKLRRFQPSINVVGGMLQRNGAKISKSKGNGIPLSKIGKEFGVDLYRLYLAITASYDVPLDFKDEEVLQLEKKFDKYKSLMLEAKNSKNKEYKDFSNLDKWLISRFYSNVKIYFDSMEELKIREAYVAIFYEFLLDINYHQRRSGEKETSKVLKFIFEDYLKLMMPVIPHICEELYDKEPFISKQTFETDIDKYINKEIEEIETIIQDLITSISRIKETKNLSKINKIKIIQAQDNKFKLFDKLKELLNESKEFKKIVPELLQEFNSEKKFISKFVPKTLGSGLSTYLSKKKETELFENCKKFIENEFNTNLEILDGNEEQDSQKAIPSKPIIIVE
jgi:leucyl-tRNA synthetase